MAKDKIKCHICGKKMRTDVIPANCVQCQADLLHPENELLQNTTWSLYYEKSVNGFAPQGILYLTNKRLFFTKMSKTANTISMIGGALGVLIATLINIKGGDYLVFDIPLDNITTVEEVKIKMTKIISIHTKDGKEYKIGGMRKRQEWINTIKGLANLTI